MRRKTSEDDDTGESFSWAVAFLDVPSFILASATVGFILSFLLTAVILFQPPAPGRMVGEHLQALALYLPGYDVSAGGAIIGGLYGAIAGGVIGAVIAFAWNFGHAIAIHILSLKEFLFRV